MSRVSKKEDMFYRMLSEQSQKLVEASDAALGVASYPVDERNAETIVGEQAAALGLRPAAGVAGAAR